MDVDKFLTNYLVPSESGLDKSFTMPLPPIAGLKEVGSFILQGNLEDTISTNIVSQYRSEEEKIRLIEVYKRTQNQVNGVFVRLVGTLSIVKKGYPFLFLDAAVSNVDPRTAERVDLSTMVAIHMPQADPEKRGILTDSLTEDAKKAGMECGTVEIPVLPDFWGPLWHVRTSGADLDTIKSVRDSAWGAYQKYCGQVDANADFDYQPTQDQMVFKNSAAEHGMFRRMGLQVATEAQAGFFSILVTGVDEL
jgi:hypothetical protein